ncbi:MAG: hypothetical protein HY223_08305 [Thaumarchaeota archaeon]|nr:hypothetical protein [Nitrososphaerota archaeon]
MLQSKKKSMALTTILAFLVVGVGHIYIGRTRRGIALLIIGLVADTLISGMAFLMLSQGDTSSITDSPSFVAVFVAASIGSLVFFIWQIMDARKGCRKYNSTIV